MCGPKSGFTLIELLIGIALWVLVAVSLAGVFQNGVRTWRRMEKTSALQQESRAVLEQIARDVRDSLDVPGIVWSSAEGKISFARVQIQRENGPQPQPVEKIIRITYQLEGTPALLKRSQQELSPLTPCPIEDRELTHRATELVWEYAYASPRAALEWLSAWPPSGVPVMPSGVRVHLTLYNEKGDTETFTKTIFIPSRTTLPWAA